MLSRVLVATTFVPLAMATCGPKPDTTHTAVTPTPAVSPLPVASPVAIVNATVWTAAGPRIEKGRVILVDGKIARVGGPDTPIPPAAQVIDVGGRNVTPGIIDVHSHNGVYPSPGVDATSDGNEMTDPTTPQVDTQYAIWPQDPNFVRVLSAGNTSSIILPGSGNLIGGRGVSIHNVPGRTVAEMKIAGAPAHLKMACGENPKRVYGKEKKSFPMTRMGNYAGYRDAFEGAKAYRAKVDKQGDDEKKEAERDMKKETLAGVLAGKILVQNHCYRAEEMAMMVELADEYGFKIRAFHHALEAYKVRDLLAARGIGVATWADWWGFKLEAWDGIPQNAALLHEAGVKAVIHSDSAVGAQRLNQEAAKAMAYGKRGGIKVTEDDALSWITSNAAWVMGMEKELGTLEAGKIGDVVVWSASPFSVYTRADLVFVQGRRVFDRADAKAGPRSDFELGVTR